MPTLNRRTTTYIELFREGVWQRVNYSDFPNIGSAQWITKMIKALQAIIDTKKPINEYHIDDPEREPDPGEEHIFRDGSDIVRREDKIIGGALVNGHFKIEQVRARSI